MLWTSKKKKEEEAKAKTPASAFETAAPPPPATPQDMLMVAIRNRNLSRVEEAIEKGADVKANGGEPLMEAAALKWENNNTQMQIALALVLKGADIKQSSDLAWKKQEEFVGPGSYGYAATILDDKYYHYETIIDWFRRNKGELLEEFIKVKVPALEKERDELKQQLDDIYRSLGKTPKPFSPVQN